MSAYYNEIDPHAAEWLRNLIREGLIAPGDVDERSIEDVLPSELAGYTQCHFFAGIGGWSYALRLAGWPDDRPVWTGSCPCQPFSAAGKGKGVDDERHLWPAFRWIIDQCRPPTVFGEQVASKLGREWLAGVRTDLEAMGYAVGAADLCAAGVGAPHIRQRAWWVADSSGERRQQKRASPSGHECAHGGRAHSDAAWGGSSGRLGYSHCEGLAERERDCGARREAGCSSQRQAAELSSHWDSYIWISCADGKARRIEPGIEPLAHGLQRCLADVRDIEVYARKEIERYGNASNTDPDEVLQMVRRAISAQAGGEEQPARVREQFHAPQVLLDFLLCVESARDGTTNASGIEKAGDEVCGRIVRGVRPYEQAGGSPCEWQPDGQRAEQFSDALLALSFVLARAAEAHREAARKAHAASGRVIMLRGLGNAIVAPLAGEFIQAYQEVAKEGK